MKLTSLFILSAGLLAGCATPDFGDATRSEYNEPAAVPQPIQAPTVIETQSTSESVSDAIREKIVSAYSGTYWVNIFPVMRDCWYLPASAEYSAEFHKSGQMLNPDLPREDTRWQRMVVTFDATGKLKWFSPRRE
jgi:hypothetical protein